MMSQFPIAFAEKEFHTVKENHPARGLNLAGKTLLHTISTQVKEALLDASHQLIESTESCKIMNR
jgi:hypothetical protein